MTTSIVDICNRALSRIGTRSTIASLDEGSAEANACQLWYDELRQQLLRVAPWGFSRATIVLTQLGDLIPDNTAPSPWLYKYAYPSDCAKFRYVLPPPILPSTNLAPNVGSVQPSQWAQGPSRSNRYVVGTDVDGNGNQITVLLSNLYQASGVYNREVTDPNQFDALFRGALTAALAYNLVAPLSGNVGQMESLAKEAERAILQARTADANESITRSDHTPDWIATRGLGGPWGVFPYVGGSEAGWTGWGNRNCGWESMSWSM